MESSGLGFVIDNVGDSLVQENAPKVDAVVKNIFDQFLQEKLNLNPPKPEEVKKLSAFEKFSQNMDFETMELKNQTAKQIKDQKKKNHIKIKLDILSKNKEKSDLQEVLSKSIVLQPDFDKQESVPSQIVSEKKLKLQRKLEREKTKGNKWFNMPATELTEEVKKDLQVLQMRSVLDPKHFYKKNDLKVLPKYFQVGKVQDSPLDYYNNRLTKKERRRTLVDELLADAEFTKYNKKKYNEVMVEKQKTHYKALRDAKRLKKKKK